MNFKQSVKVDDNHYGLIEGTEVGQRRSIGVNRHNSDVNMNQNVRRHPMRNAGHHQETATSDFLNRFKGKISTISKEGVSGMIASASKPIERAPDALDKVGFRSGMTSLSYAVPQRGTIED